MPERLGPYLLDRLLATGGMGEVYLAHHMELGSEVAIKLLPALPLDSMAQVRERFAREARLTAKVQHRGVVRVFSSDAFGDRPYLVLELVHGTTLRHVLRDGPLPPTKAARIVAETLDILAAAHAMGVLHRDIKPDNVMLEPDGHVRILDFGIARAIADDTPLTRTGEIVGTPEYMAPEQLLEGPEATDERTDVHAAGVLLYELLTGRSPFRAANLFQSLKLVESLVPPAPLNAPSAPHDLNAVVLRALEKQPDDRYATASQMADAIRQAVPAIENPPSNDQRRTWPLWLAAAGMLFGVTAMVSNTIASRPAVPVAKSAQTSFTVALQVDAPQAVDRNRGHTTLLALVNRGLWCAALVQSERALAAGEDDARKVAQQALVLSHAAWLQAAGLPTWLAAYDLARCDRLLGDLLEPGDGSTDSLRALLRGDRDAWQQLSMQPQLPDSVRQLLQVPAHPDQQHAGLFAVIAQRLPIDAPEHWLARTIERHLHNDAVAATQAAEMAWLTGAGELAILLDAALAMRSADATERQRLWHRMAKSDRGDCPASTLLMLYLESHGVAGIEFEPEMARDFPVTHRAAVSAWFVQQATATKGATRMRLLRIAVALAAMPDFQQAPWSLLPTAAQTQLQAEARGGK